jgi:RNA polymerase sigma factor (sigma-70 family)
MCTAACQQVLKNNGESITKVFTATLKQDADKIISCFYNCLKQSFTKWAVVMYNSYPEDTMDFITNTAFTDSVLLFTDRAAAGKIYESNASLKTILFSFYKNKVLEQLQKENRLAAKNKKLVLDNTQELTWIPDDTNTAAEKRFTTLQQALAKMAPADRQIIIWRHLQEKNCDEIATLLGITVTSATNRIYRCMQRLRHLIENING